MKILAACLTCVEQRGATDLELFAMPPNAEGYYRVTCAYGHELAYVAQSPLHETLGDIALSALVDGYPRESVMTMTAAVERLYEFYVRAVLGCRDVEANDMDELWRAVSRQSERQLGLFVGIFTVETGRPPPLNKKAAEFRNHVVHKGYIPTEAEAIEYGEAMVSLAIPVLTELREAHLIDVVEKMTSAATAKGVKRAKDEGVRYATFFPVSLFGGHPQTNFRAALDQQRQKLAIFQATLGLGRPKDVPPGPPTG